MFVASSSPSGEQPMATARIGNPMASPHCGIEPVYAETHRHIHSRPAMHVMEGNIQSGICHIKGWFSKTSFETLRLRVKIRFLSICPAERAKVLLQSVSEEFDKCKKALSKIRRHAAEHQQLSQDSELLGTVGCAKSNSPEHHGLDEDGPSNCQIENDEDGEEEEEVGDEEEWEEEEEVDKSDYPIVGMEDAFFSSETGSGILEDKVGASDYMQDVLRSEFMFCKDGKDSRSGKEIRQADSSDGEYQIYEQDSDGFDDDDDF